MTSNANRIAANADGYLTVEQRTAVNHLRSAGYCVVLFSPTELGQVLASDLEDDLRTCAEGIIETFNNIKEKP